VTVADETSAKELDEVEVSAETNAPEDTLYDNAEVILDLKEDRSDSTALSSSTVVEIYKSNRQLTKWWKKLGKYMGKASIESLNVHEHSRQYQLLRQFKMS